MAIEFRGVSKAFGPKEVLRGIDLDAHDGKTLAVLGRSGAGKSVLLKHVVGLIQPDAGVVLVDGTTVAEREESALLDLRRDVGYVFQFAALFDSMTITENVKMGLNRMDGLSVADVTERVESCLDRVELTGLGDRYPSELSGGQKKRAGIARAIATEPRYLLYDEPTSGLDPITGTVIDRLIVRMRDELGATGIVVTHDMNSAYHIADSIALLHEGSIHFVGSPEEFRTAQDPIVRSFVEGRPELLEQGAQ
ncbi:MAG: phospholipid/cholesterol/gamma-HCH transport system ATP-binding protein [Myxococcota bacterium]